MNCRFIVKKILTPALTVIVTVSVGVFLLSINVSAEGITKQLDLTIPSACTMSGSGSGSHTASTQGNNYTEGIGTTTLQAFCNDSAGFAIYAIGYTDDEMGKTVLTDSSLGNTYDIASGTATSGGTSNWAMKLAIAQDTNDTTNNPFTLDNGFGDYSVVPNAYTKVAHKDTSTDMTSVTGGVKLTTTYAAFASATQPAGTYTGQVKYTLVHPASEIPQGPVDCAAGKICYQPNAADAIGQMGDQSASDSATTMLYAGNFKRTGYGFAGWNDKYDYSGNFYGPTENITAPADVSTSGLSLYAVWVESAGDLQGWTGCSAMQEGDVTALTDTRDNDTYAVAKLVDGKCWMIENLRLADKDSNGNDVVLNSANTNNPSLPLINTWWYSSANDNDTIPTSNHLSANNDPTIAAWCKTNSSNCDDQSMLVTDNTALFASNTSSNYSISSNVYGYGNYYNWYSATAGRGTYSTTGNMVGDICPSGWRLPKSGTKTNEANNEFWSLIVIGLKNGIKPDNYDSSSNPYYNGSAEAAPVASALKSYPNNFVYSGSVYNTSVRNRGSSGLYWTAYGYNNNFVYYLSIGEKNIYPGTNYQYRYFGGSIRCLMDA